MNNEFIYTDQLTLEQNNKRLKLEELFSDITNKIFYDILRGLKINFIHVSGTRHFSVEDLLHWAIRHGRISNPSNIDEYFIINSCLDQNGFRASILIEGNQSEIFKLVRRAIKLKVFL